MPSLERIRKERISELVEWGKKVQVINDSLPYDRLLDRATELWPSLTRRTLESYVYSALQILNEEKKEVKR